METSKKFIVIGVIALVILIVLIVIVNSFRRTSKKKVAPQQDSTAIPRVEPRYARYKDVAPKFSPFENELISKIKRTLPYQGAKADILFEDSVGQFIVTKKADGADAEFREWLKDNNLEDLYAKYPGLFAETDIPAYSYRDYVTRFADEPVNLPSPSRFDKNKKLEEQSKSKLDKKIKDIVSLFQAVTQSEVDIGSLESQSSQTEQNFGNSDIAKILPDPLPPISSKVYNDERRGFLERCPKNIDVYKEAQAKTGVYWEILAGIHYREGTCDPNNSVISGRRVGIAEPDNGGQKYTTLLSTAIAAANEFKGKNDGKVPQNFNELVATAQKYHGVGGKNCGQVSLYKGPCPPPDGIDDPYPMNNFDEEHDEMYIIYCEDHKKNTKGCPRLDYKPGIATAVRILVNRY